MHLHIQVLVRFQFQKIQKKIGIGCFYQSRLIQVELPKNSELESIESYSFYSSLIDYFYVPASVKYIDSNTFYYCRILEISKDSKYIKFLSSSIKSIENLLIFSQQVEFEERWNGNISTLNNIELSKSITQYKYIDGKYLMKKSNPESDVYDILLYVSRNTYIATIPSSVTTISFGAFTNCEQLREIMFEANSKLTIIHNEAFNCKALTTITIPKHVKKIPNLVFYKHGNLKFVNFDENSELELIENAAFEFTGIEYIKILRNVKIIESYAFDNCTCLEKVEIPQNSKLEIIGSAAFNNTIIKEIYIPKFVKKINYGAFMGCFQLQTVLFSKNSDLIEFDENVFEENVSFVADNEPDENSCILL